MAFNRCMIVELKIYLTCIMSIEKVKYLLLQKYNFIFIYTRFFIFYKTSALFFSFADMNATLSAPIPL